LFSATNVELMLLLFHPKMNMQFAKTAVPIMSTSSVHPAVVWF
jgi:hypothetical protein